MFASLVLDREPMRLSDVPAAALGYLHTVGAIAAILLIVARIVLLLRDPKQARREIFYNSLAVVVVLLYGAYFLFSGEGDGGLARMILYVAAGTALVAVLWPLVRDLVTRVSWQRIWAIARLSIKEAIRGKIVVLFGILALSFLFIGWFVGYKEEDQVRNYVLVIFRSMSLVFLIAFTFLGAFSIPSDIKRQNIHTIVTKPVEKIEIVLGRFFGFGTLMTVGLALWTILSYGYLLRGVTPDAAYESFKAREPVFGKLIFYPTPEGSSVGREHDYRRYIAGVHPSSPPGTPREYAIFTFNEMPNLGQENIAFEFTLDIFRLVKAEVEGKGIFCSFLFADPRYEVPQLEEALDRMRQQRIELRRKIPDPAEVEKQLLERFRLYEIAGFELHDYRTKSVQVPAAFFQAIRKDQQNGFKTFIVVDRASGSNMVGMARRDLYMLADVHPFWQNFVKGILALWLLFLLAMGVAVALSTYLSSVIAWLMTLFLLLLGLPLDYIKDLAENKAAEGGPMVSIMRISGGLPLGASLEEKPGAAVAQSIDDVFRWYLRQYLNIIPDIGRFDLNVYVGNGFDAPWLEVMGLDLVLYWLAYLIPWFVLAYYLLKFREIALPT